MKAAVKLLLSFLVLLLFFQIAPAVHAQPEYVDECLENPELCEEPETGGNEAEQESALLQEEEGGSLFIELIRLFFALLLVVGLIYVALFFLRRNNRLGGRLKTLENLGGISVGQNKSVQLVRLGSRVYVIGVGDDVTLLEEINDPELIEEILKAKQEQESDFKAADFLSSLVQKKNNEENKQKFTSLFKQELARLQKNRKSIIDRNKEDRHG
jgi:flagellar protein FliO/FliZ